MRKKLETDEMRRLGEVVEKEGWQWDRWRWKRKVTTDEMRRLGRWYHRKVVNEKG